VIAEELFRIENYGEESKRLVLMFGKTFYEWKNNWKKELIVGRTATGPREERDQSIRSECSACISQLGRGGL
jgi:hypothetical protein